MIRFHVVVFNFERINSFLNHFDKITNFSPVKDRIVILDCSRNWRSQTEEVVNFAQRHGWEIGREIKFLRRRNWGIDQGARIDYLQSLFNDPNPPQFIWQFQEHYLDLESPWSFLDNDNSDIGRQLKADTIPDNVRIDLDLCETVYRQHSAVQVIYADRKNVGVFKYSSDPSFYADGANFSVRTSYALQSLPREMLASYKMIYDASYTWTLFIELDIGRRLTQDGAYWYDLVTSSLFDSLAKLKDIEINRKHCLHQEAEEFYVPLYRRYEEKLQKALVRSPFSRKLKSDWIHAYWTLTQSSFVQRQLKPLIRKAGIAAPGQLGKKLLLREDTNDSLSQN